MAKYNNSFLCTFAIAFGITSGLLAATGVLAWTGPSAAAPANNASAPLNTSSAGQVKVGGLQLNTGGAANGLIVTKGYVGIGNTSPGTFLDITGNNVPYGGQLRIMGADYDQIVFGSSANMALDGTGRLGDIYYDVIAKALYVENQAGSKNLILNQGGGNVGIGIATPGAKLQVSSGDAPALLLGPNASWGQYLEVGGWRSGNNASVMTSDGNLHLDAKSGHNIYLNYFSNTTVSVTGNMSVSGQITAAAFYYSSDERLKKNIEAIASSTVLQKILALQPVTFNWIDPKQPTTTQLGFIAQQVEGVVPELVTTNPSTGMKAVDYARVTPLLVGALQAQETKIDAQQKEIDELKAEVAALKEGLRAQAGK